MLHDTYGPKLEFGREEPNPSPLVALLGRSLTPVQVGGKASRWGARPAGTGARGGSKQLYWGCTGWEIMGDLHLNFSEKLVWSKQ